MELSKKQKLMQSIITAAWEDQTFKNQLLENPKKIIENLTGNIITLPEGKRIQAVDQTDPNIIYINIPEAPNMESMELNEEQLEVVAGGGFPVPDLNGILKSISRASGNDDFI